MTTFLKGDTTAEITLALAGGYDYSGKTVHLEYQGARRAFTGCVAGGALTFAFSAEETAPMSLGAYPVCVWIEGGGEVLTVHNADVKLRVTDRVSEVHGGGAICLDVRGGLHGIEGLPERYTDEDLRDKVNEILRRLGGTVAALLLCALPAYGAGVVVQTAPKGRIFNDQRIVTNVVFDASGLARTDELPPAPDYSTNNTELVQTVRDTSPAPDFSTSNDVLVATIEATAPPPDDYDAVKSNAVGALPRASVCRPFASKTNYSAGDVVEIDGRFYIFEWDYRWQYGDPIDGEFVRELPTLADVAPHIFNQSFLALGEGGTNTPSEKRINTGDDGYGGTSFFSFIPDGFKILRTDNTELRLFYNTLRIYNEDRTSYREVNLRQLLSDGQAGSLDPYYLDYDLRASYFVSPYYVHAYLTNNYPTRTEASAAYLAKADAASGYVSKADGVALTNGVMTSVAAKYLPATPYGNYRVLVGPLHLIGDFMFEGGWDSLTVFNGQTLPEYLGEREEATAQNIADATNRLAQAMPSTASDVGAYPASDGNLLATQVSAIGAHLNAEDAHFVCTNYDSVVHTPEAYVEIKMSNSWITIWREMTRWNQFTGVDFDWTDWNGFHSFKTNVEAELSFKADRAWGAYDSETGGYSPEGYTQISSSNILIAAGMAYQRTVTSAGAVWVLQCNQGTAHIGGDTNGFFRVLDGEGATQFEIIKGDRREMGCDATGITVGSGSPPVLTIPYSVDAAEHPTLRICDDMGAQNWKDETDSDCLATVEWSGSSGAYVATVQRKAAGDRLFVKATYMAGGETYVRNVAPVSVEGGILCTDGIHKVRPVYNNGNITWEVVP